MSARLLTTSSQRHSTTQPRSSTTASQIGWHTNRCSQRSTVVFVVTSATCDAMSSVDTVWCGTRSSQRQNWQPAESVATTQFASQLSGVSGSHSAVCRFVDEQLHDSLDAHAHGDSVTSSSPSTTATSGFPQTHASQPSSPLTTSNSPGHCDPQSTTAQSIVVVFIAIVVVVSAFPPAHAHRRHPFSSTSYPVSPHVRGHAVCGQTGDVVAESAVGDDDISATAHVHISHPSPSIPRTQPTRSSQSIGIARHGDGTPTSTSHPQTAAHRVASELAQAAAQSAQSPPSTHSQVSHPV